MYDDWTTRAPYVCYMADLVVVPTMCADSTAHEDKLARSGLGGERDPDGSNDLGWKRKVLP